MVKKSKAYNAEALVSTILMLIFSLVLVFEIFSIDIPESRILPLVSLIIAISACIGQFINYLKDTETTKTWHDIVFKRKELLIILLLFISYFLIEILGFYFTLFLLSFVLMLIVQNKIASKQFKIAIIYALSLTIVSYIGFAVLLQLVTPTGFLI